MRSYNPVLLGALALLLSSVTPVFSQALPPISFNASGLINESSDNPTSLQFGPDGRLYVAQQDGIVYAYTIERDDAAPGSGTYSVVAEEEITLIKNNVPNHNDDGAANGVTQRQVTGLLVTGTAETPVLYVTSSDWRIGGGGSGSDLNLDTNSGVLTKLTKTANGWDKVDLIRGMPRCEENHSTNGMALSGNTLLIQSGGHTNKGAVSNNFSGTPEYMLSGVLLRADLGMLNSMPVYTDPRSGVKFVYDLPTLNDPTRADITNADAAFPYPSGHPLYNATIDEGDPFGGNNSLNQAFAEPGGPVQVFSHGWRNAYDIVITTDGHLFSSDNGPNSGWGGQPLIYLADGTYKGVEGEDGVTYNPENGDYITNEFNESSSSGHHDPLHYIGHISDADGTYYAGHPAPIQAFPSKARVIVYQESGDTWLEQANYDFDELLPGVSGYFNTSFSIADFPDRPEEGAYTTGNIGGAGINILDMISGSTNGIAEYTASNFGGQMQGDILTASFNGNIYRYKIAPNNLSYDIKETLFGGFGSQPLDVIAQGDADIFPGTVWAVTYGADVVTVFEPEDFGNCPQPDEVGVYDPLADYDGDGFANDDEIAAGTNHCSAGSVPNDNDGDFISDVTDPDDDNDGIPDDTDEFALDADNGTTTDLPINYSFFNSDPGTGLFGLGFTGLMTNGLDDYLDLFDVDNLSAGGAAGKLGIDAVPEGDALGASNDQQYGFQIGINVDANSGSFTVRSAVESPFFLVNGTATTPVDFQSQGIFIGTGDQDNYLRVVFMTGTDNGDNVYGMEVLLEDGGTPTAATYDITDIELASAVEIYIAVDPAAGTAQPAISLDNGVSIIPLGAAITLPVSFLDPNDGKGMAVGVITTSAGPGDEFSASWDYMSVTPDQPGVLAADPAQVDFGQQKEDANTIEVDIELFNLGSPTDVAIDVTELSFTGPDQALFTSSATLPVTIAPGNELILPISFTPGSVLGSKSATLEVLHSGANSPLLVPLSAEVIESDEILIRINAGSPGIAASDGGPDWEDNTTLSGPSYTVISDANKTSTHNIPASGRHASIPAYVDNATFTALFTKERWDQAPQPELQFVIPLPNNDYKVNLYMGNGYFGTSEIGDRVFDVKIEGVVVQDNLDLVATFGHQIGGMIQYDVTVDDGELNIEFLHVAENPLINGIEIIGPPFVLPPIVVEPIADQTNQIGESPALAVSATGGNQQGNFTYAISGQPAGIDIESTNGQIIGVVAASALSGGPAGDGVHDVTVTVSKPGSEPVSVDFTWTIVNVPDSWHDQTDDENYTARHECSFVQAGDKFYLLGGRESTTTLDVYDYATKTWSPIPDSAPISFNHFQATEYQGLIWVIGAFKDNNFPVEAPEDHIWAYDPANDEWIQGPEIPDDRQRGSTGLVVYGDKFYVVGGNTIGHDGGYVAWFDVYDPATGVWQALEDAPRARDHFHAVVVGNKLYAAGGRLTGGPSGVYEPLIAEVDVFDFGTMTWSTLPAEDNLPTPRAAAAAVAFQNQLFIIGGEIGDDLDGNTVNDAVKNTEAYDPELGTWSTKADLLIERHATQAIVSGNGIHIAAGSNTKGGGGGLGKMKEMEYFGADAPEGEELVAYTFQAPTTVQIPIGGATTFQLSNVAGNVGIVLGEMTLSQPNPGEFNVVAGAGLAGFIPSASDHDITVGFTGTEAGQTATLTVPYGATGTAVITLESIVPQPTVEYRINAGGPSQVSPELNWSADQSAVDANGSAVTGTPSPYVNTEDADQTYGTNPGGFVNTTGYLDELFKTDRYSEIENPNNMQWDFPVDNGDFEVRLLFAERWSLGNGVGIRVFDVVIEGNTVLTDFDQTATYNWNTAGVETFLVTVSDGNLDIDFIKKIQNPNVKAIEIIALNGTGSSNIPPVVTNPGDQTNQEGEVINLAIAATAPENSQSLTYSATGLPPDLTIDPTSGVISGTIDAGDPGAAADSPFDVIVTVTDDGDPAASTMISFQWFITLEPTAVGALIQVNPGLGIDANTFDDDAFVITNTGAVDITNVTIDLSTAVLPESVFDPIGVAGDNIGKCLTAGSNATPADVGLSVPGDGGVAGDPDCENVFSSPHNGVDGDEGYDVISLDFSDLNPTEIFSFGVDVDPLSVKDNNTAGDAGSVSGFELTGATVTVTFANGTTLTTTLWDEGSLGGSQAVVEEPIPTPAPTLTMVGLALPMVTNDANQTVEITGTPNAAVTLIQVDARLYIDAAGGGYNIDPFEANEAMTKVIYTTTLDGSGVEQIPVTLLHTATTDAGPDGGLNHFLAVENGTGEITSLASNVLVVEYDPDPVANGNLTLNVGMQGRTDHSGDYTVAVYATSDLTTPLFSYTDATADAAGAMTLPDQVPDGTYRVAVKHAGFLQRVIDVTMSGTHSTTVPPLLAGDIDGNNFVNIDDFDLLSDSFFIGEGSPGFNAGADFDGNGFVNIDDFDLLAENFFTGGETVIQN